MGISTRTVTEISCDLCGKWSALARALETSTTRSCPRQGIALTVGDRDDRVVKRRMHVGDTLSNILFNFLSYAYISFCHVAFFLTNKLTKI